MLESEAQRQNMLTLLGDRVEWDSGVSFGIYTGEYAEELGVGAPVPAVKCSAEDLTRLAVVEGLRVERIELTIGGQVGPFTVRRLEPEGAGAMVNVVLKQA